MFVSPERVTVTVVGSLGPALQRDDTLELSAGEIGWAASAYIAGAVLGALFFGRLADKLGRKRMFLVTLVVYLIATVATAVALTERRGPGTFTFATAAGEVAMTSAETGRCCARSRASSGRASRSSASTSDAWAS